MSKILDATWWRSIAGALLRTVLAALVPFIPALVADPAGTWEVAALTVGLVLVLAVASALRSIPTAGSWWEVAIQRALRQFGQMVAAAAGSAVLLTDVDWRTVLIAAAGSALSTLVIAALASLPEALVVATVTPDGAAVITNVGTSNPTSGLTVHVTFPDLGKPIPPDDEPARHLV